MSFRVCNHNCAWSEFLSLAPAPHLLQSWGWGELKSEFGWKPIRLVVTRNNRDVAGAQILFRKMGPLSLAYIPKGPVLLEHDTDTRQSLLDALTQTCQSEHAISLKVEPSSLNKDRADWAWLENHSFSPDAQEIQPRRSIVVDVSREPEEILAAFKSKWRYNTRLSQRHGVTIKRQGIEALDDFYSIMQVTGERDGFGIHSQAYYASAMQAFSQEGKVVLLMAYYEGTPIAGIMVPAFRKEAIYMYGGSLNEHRRHMPNHQLQYEAMVWAHEQGCKRYDLWGIPDADIDANQHNLGGVGRFKSGFGGTVERYAGAYEKVYKPAVHWLTQKAIKARRKILS